MDFQDKNSTNGSIEKFKARFVAQGFSQNQGIDYEENFAPVARYASIRIVLAMASKMKWNLHQMDVKITLLLKKSLYGLQQVPRAWYGRIDGFLMNLGFTKIKVDSNLYYKVEDDGIMILLLYVHDLLLKRKDSRYVHQ